jgi:hypothetical protein
MLIMDGVKHFRTPAELLQKWPLISGYDPSERVLGANASDFFTWVLIRKNKILNFNTDYLFCYQRTVKLHFDDYVCFVLNHHAYVEFL